MMSLEEENRWLRAENAELLQQVVDLKEALGQLESERDEAREAVEKAKRKPPSWVKPNKAKKEGPKPPRRKREASANKARRREAPTRVVEHTLERCPDCNYPLFRRKVAHVHQVVDIPPPVAVEVTEHRAIGGWCPHCRRWHAPRLDLGEEVLGQGRLGVRVTSLIVHLRTVMRLPFRQIQDFLKTYYQLHVGLGELVELLHRVRRAGQGQLDVWWEAAQASSVMHMDETGWREDGRNGFVWTVSVPGKQGIRCFTREGGRSHLIVKGLVGGSFKGVLCSDFLASYNTYAGRHQRCWAHLLRALHELKEDHPEDQQVHAWASAVRELYDEGQAMVQATSPPSGAQRLACYEGLVRRAVELGQRYALTKKHPCQALAKRLLRHQDELFPFVLYEQVSADNNLAERSLRPLVIARKISGGTRSPAGTATRMALASLVATWKARGLNPFTECLALLRQSSLP
jgi:transposase